MCRCDGRCIPHDWVSDGWPDCMDGADEATLAVDGKVETMGQLIVEPQIDPSVKLYNHREGPY